MGRRKQGDNSPLHWDELEPELQERFSCSGSVEVYDYYFADDANSEIFYDKNLVDQMIKAVRRRQTNYYGHTDFYLYCALEKYSIKDKDVAILGSITPWYESICLGFDGKPTTLEYNKLQTNDPRLSLVTVEDYNKDPRQFDAAFTISSFEHDGLGRYGDKVNPDGDLEAMKHTKEKVLKPGGLLFLAVPCGVDKVAFNAHRIYGKDRFEKLTKGFEVVETFPSNFYELLENDTGREATQQPVVVLRVPE